jgi:thiol-disulfide isomerase/thioredoxin
MDMKKLISDWVILSIAVVFMFSACNKPESKVEDPKSNAATETAQTDVPAEIQPNSADSDEATPSVEVDESLIMDAESPQNDFIDETSEPESTPSTENSSERKSALLKKLFNYEQALQAAKANGKPILLDFTGSDWCPPCMRMEQEVFSTEQFALFANENLNFVYLDFPRRKKMDLAQAQHNSSLAEKYKIEGYPTIILLNNQGVELGRIEQYLSGGPQKLINWIQQTQPK